MTLLKKLDGPVDRSARDLRDELFSFDNFPTGKELAEEGRLYEMRQQIQLPQQASRHLSPREQRPTAAQECPLYLYHMALQFRDPVPRTICLLDCHHNPPCKPVGNETPDHLFMRDVGHQTPNEPVGNETPGLRSAGQAPNEPAGNETPDHLFMRDVGHQTPNEPVGNETPGLRSAGQDPNEPAGSARDSNDMNVLALVEKDATKPNSEHDSEEYPRPD